MGKIGVMPNKCLARVRLPLGMRKIGKCWLGLGVKGEVREQVQMV